MRMETTTTKIQQLSKPLVQEKLSFRYNIQVLLQGVHGSAIKQVQFKHIM